MLTEILENGSLTHTMKQGVITLIPKPGKDPTLLDNLRPITLLNNDYKLLTHIFANRLKSGITQIISDTQSGFIKGRSIHNNIRLILDLIDYNYLIENQGFVLFLDFYKAFDMIEHEFMFQALDLFGFGGNFINLIKLLYRDTNSSVCLPRGTSQRFRICRGIKQGCPISPLLFIAATEMLSILIKNAEFGKISILGKELSISQLADDTTIFLNNLNEIPKILQIIETFSKASGLKLNLNKCEILPLKDCTISNTFNIPVKSTVKYLGVYITKNKNDLDNLNIWEKIQICRTHLNNWAQRDLSILGRIFLTKMESISRLVYPAYAVGVPKSAIKAINQLNFDFIWKRKTHYIRQGNLVKRFEDGGLQAIEFDSLNGTLKINWLRSFLRSQNSLWFHIPSKIFSDLGGINLLLRCDFDIRKLPIKLSSFHQQVLLYWKLIYKHNYSPHNTPIWNCRYIKVGNKSIFMEKWYDKGIWSVMHLLNDRGKILLEDFTANYDLQINNKEFQKITKAIPQNILCTAYNLFQNPDYRSPDLPELLVNGHNITANSLKYSQIRELFTNVFFPYRSNPNSISHLFSGDQKKEIRKNYLKLPIPPKAKEVHYKILSGVYPSKEFLRRRFAIDDNCCSFCNGDIESTEHLFYDCIFCKALWNDVHYWLFPKIPNLLEFSKNDIMFGSLRKEKKLENVLNVIIIMGKFFIHKCHFLKTKPSFFTFHKELCLFFSSVKFMDKKQALDLNHMIVELDLLENP
uniref:Reverse transcriptase domain-containing protein n=1 Tax=Oreochromis niloticus TaxID=8128 RepID=A0A669EBX3_ORENI